MPTPFIAITTGYSGSKDHKGRKLREGESWRKDGRYSYRYTDIRSGKRLTVYARDLPELREKEKQIAKDLEDNILTDGAIKKLTLNKLFERYMSTRELKESTRANYLKTWENRVKDEIGNIKVVQILPSHIKSFYSKLSKAGYAYSTIKVLQYIMGHAHIDVTMDVYNHVSEMSRIESEITRLESVAISWYQK